MAVTLATTVQDRCTLGYNETGTGVCGWNGNNYDPNTNPGGFGNGGHRFVLLPLLLDVLFMMLQTASNAAMVAGAINQQQAWIQIMGANGLPLPVTRLNATDISIPGFFPTVIKVGRSVQLGQTANATGWIVACPYNSGTQLTTITVRGCIVDTGLTALWFGQDPANAPYVATSPASNLYLAANFMTA